MRRELDVYLDASDNVAKSLAQQLRNREISLSDFELLMRREIKRTHLNAIALERGGWSNMRPSDYGRAGQIIRREYGFLKNFGNDIASGKQRLDGTLDRRAQMYTDAGRSTFYASKHANLKTDIVMVRSIRHARDSCAQCITLDGRWFRIGDPEYRIPGQRICRSNCRCSEELGRFTADGPVAVERV